MTAKSHYVIVWEFIAKPGAEVEFENVYGPRGDWAQLFAKSEGFLNTELLKVGQAARRYLVIDRWESAAHFAAFEQKFANEYQQLNLCCEALTEREAPLGTFDTVA